MANTGFKGLSVRQTGNQLVFRAFLQSAAGALLGTGTTVLAIMELQSDGTIKSYDFNDNTFKTTALTTPTLALTHRPSNNAGTTTGLWTVALSTLTGFTVGGIYLVLVNNTGAYPTDLMMQFQYGGAEGDAVTTAGATGIAYLQSDATLWKTGTIPTPTVAGVPNVNAKTINDVATTSITTINANLGNTQPINFTGTGASALVKSDAIDWNSVAVTGMPMPTYAQPTGFLAATFPSGTVANTTNITAGTIANLTNAPTVGDFTATMKTSLNAATPASVQNIVTQTADAASRMATYTQPTGFLAATFPSGTVANTTNITAGTIANLTNLPAVPTDWLTAAGVKADAVTKIQTGLSTYAGGDTSGTTTLLTRVTAAVATASALATLQTNVTALGSPMQAGATVVLTDASLTAAKFGTDAISAAAVSAAAVTKIQAGLGTSASQTTILNAVNAVTTNTARSAPRVPDFMARSTAGTVDYTGDLYLYTLQGLLEDADANAVTVHARNAAGSNLDGGLASTTMTRLSTGKYRLTYTVASIDTAQAVYFDFTWQIAAVAMADGAAAEVQDAENYAYLAAIKAKTDNLPASPAATGAKMDLVNAPNATAIAAIQSGLSTYAGGDTSGTTTLLTRVTAAVALAGSAPSWYTAPVDVSTNVAAIKVKTDFLPSVIAGGAGGVFIAGTNAATTVTTSFTTTFTGNLTGSVASVATDGISAAAVSAAAVTKIQSGLSTYAGGDTSGTTTLLTRVTAAVGSPMQAGATVALTDGSLVTASFGPCDLTATMKASVTAAVPTVAAIVAQITVDHGNGSYLRNTEPPSASQNATAVWTTTTVGDFAVVGSPGSVLVAQLGGTFTSTSSSVFTALAMANAGGGSGGSTASQIVTAIFTAPFTSSDFSTPRSFGSYTKSALPRIGTGQIVTTAIVTADGAVNLVAGDDYYFVDGRSIPFTDSTPAWPDLTGALSITFSIPSVVGAFVTGTCDNPGATNQTIRFNMPTAVTSLLAGGTRPMFKIQVVLADGHTERLVTGIATILA